MLFDTTVMVLEIIITNIQPVHAPPDPTLSGSLRVRLAPSLQGSLSQIDHQQHILRH